MPLTLLAKALVNRAPLVLLAVALLTATALLWLPRTSADFTPSDLFASFEGQADLEAEVRERFGALDNVVVVLVQGEDVLSLEALQWQHSVNLALNAVPQVESVVGLTTVPLPRLIEVAVAPQEESSGQLRELAGAIGRRLSGGDASPSAPDPAPTSTRLESRTAPAVTGEVVSQDAADTLRHALPNAPLLQGRLVSDSGELAILAVTLSRDMTRAADLQAAVSSIADTLRTRPPPEGYTVALSGLPAIRMVVVERMRADQAVLLPASVLVCLLLLFAAFRWWPALVLPLLSVSVGTLWLVGGMAMVGEPFNIINNIVPMMMVIIGISNAIHVISRFGEETRLGHPVPEATWRAISAMLVACFLTSITTAVGFASLAVSETPILARFGLTAGAGVMLVYVSTMLVLAATLRYLPAPGERTLIAESGRIEALASAVAGWSARHARTIAPLALLLFVASTACIALIRVDSAVLDQFHDRDPIAQTSRLIEAELGGIRPLDILIRVEDPTLWENPEWAHTLERLADQAAELEVVLDATTHYDLLRQARVMLRRDPALRYTAWTAADLRSTHAVASETATHALMGYLAADRHSARIQLRVADAGAKATLEAGRVLEAHLEDELAPFEGVEWHLTGDAWTGSLGLRLVIEDLVSSLLLAFLIIFGFLAVLLRSLRLGLLSILPNVLPLALTVAWMAMRGIQLNTATAIIFSISIGMAVDGTIHMLVRYREERSRAGDARAAILASARGTGRAILLTCVSLALGFGVMLLSGFLPVQRFGELISITVLGVLLSTMLVLPALMQLFADSPGTTSSTPARPPHSETGIKESPRTD